MHRSRLGAIVIDCRTDDLSTEAAFWGRALGLEPESADAQRNPRYVKLLGASGEPQVLLQQVDHDSRVHLDVETDDIPAEVARLEKLGARVVKRLARWVVMQAPSGHRFCVVGNVRDGLDRAGNAWE